MGGIPRCSGVEFRVEGGRVLLLGSWVLVKLLEVNSEIPDWWKAEGFCYSVARYCKQLGVGGIPRGGRVEG